MGSGAEMLQGVRRLHCSPLTLRNRWRRLHQIIQSRISRGEFQHQASVHRALRIIGSVSMKIVNGVVEVIICE